MKGKHGYCNLIGTIMALFLISCWMPLVAAGAPTTTTGTATGIMSSQATLNGVVNANGMTTTVKFEIGTTTSYGGVYDATQSPISGSTAIAVDAVAYELEPDTTYHFRVVATNAAGTTNGADMTFTTLPRPPMVLTMPATSVGGDIATLNAIVNANGYSTTVNFEYGTDTGYGTTVPADQSPLNPVILAVAVTNTISGLADNTIFHYRVVATNIGGTTYGEDMTFATGNAGAPPTASTTAATAIGSDNATLNGIVNASSLDTTVTFEYGLSTSYGSVISGNPSPISGNSNTPINSYVGDLAPGTTYHYRIVAVNAIGTTSGSDMTFTTLPQPPIAVSNPASNVGNTTATLNGIVAANNSSTTVTFQYGLTTGYGTTVTADQSPVTGSAGTAASRTISGLTNSVTYHYRIVAVNAGGTTYGADQTFITGVPAPTATTNAATAIGSTTTILNGTVNANGSDTQISFQVGLTTAYDRSLPATPAAVAGTANTPVSLPLNDLTPNTTYHFRIMAVNIAGTVYGADRTFTTTAAPKVVTDLATAVGTTGTTLNATVNAYNNSSIITFEYGITTAYGTTVTADQSPVTGSVDTAVNKAITGLTPNMVYHYRAVGQNIIGTTYGADRTFATTISAPTATTTAASQVLYNEATLNGLVDANNSETSVTFEYGLTTAYGSTITADQSPLPGSLVGAEVSASITGLSNNTTYHFRIVAQNAYGATPGNDMTFITSFAPTAVTGEASNVGGMSATLNGSGNANSFGAQYFFEYGTDTLYGTQVIADPNLLTGNVTTPLSASITGLAPNTTYHFRAKAQGFTTVYGEDNTFTTTNAPTVIVDPAGPVGPTAVTLNCTVNAGGADTAVTCEWGETADYGRTTLASQSPVTGNTDTPVSITISDLTPNTTYHYRIMAQNVNGAVYSGDMIFVTSPLLPTAVTNAASAITGTGATLNGTVNPNGTNIDAWFEYGLDTGYGSTIPVDQSPISGIVNKPVSAVLSGLTSNVTYHYRLVAMNSSGIVYAGDRTFVTVNGAPPIVATVAAGNVGATIATLNGTVNANNSPTTVTFEYGFDTNYGRTAIATQSPVTGSTNTAINANLINLTPTTVYHYRVLGQNDSGVAYGADMTFTTAPLHTIVVTTAEASGITPGSAVSGGVVLDDGGALVTSRGVCWSTTPDPVIASGNFTSDGSGEGAFVSYITGLSSATTYYVRAYAVNYQGTYYGNQVQFTTNSSNVSVTITSPKEGAAVTGTVAIRANARTTDGEILSVDFYIDGVHLGKDLYPPYQISWNTDGYATGDHKIKAVATNTDNLTSRDTVTVTISSEQQEPSMIWINRNRFTFGATGNHATPAQTLLIENSGSGPLNWQATSNASWLSCAPSSGSGAALVTISVNATGLSAGTYTSTIAISDPNAVNSPVTISVALKVHPNGSTCAPFGSFTTPIEGSIVRGSVPVTGWVLDDIGIDSVKIYRDPVKGEGGSPVYIGDATLVDGARPDTEEAFPGYPQNYKAGWGYMLLTYFLPGQGNGSYTLRVVATDAEGKQATLGTRTIVCDNANAAKPFGAIDTPPEGAVISGASYINYGWALTPQPNSIPTDGSTIEVWIDGALAGQPVYNIYRSDIADFFPGYANSDGAVGYFRLNTTAYQNGLHTISWTAADSAGNRDCIGSRYFTINNTISGASDGETDDSAFANVPFADENNYPAPLPLNKQFLPPVDSSDDEPLPHSDDFGSTIMSKELERVTVFLGTAGSKIEGYLSANGTLRSLPVGTTLDAASGIFSWTPGPGFVGWYSFKFIITTTGYSYDKSIEVFIEPKFKLED